MVGAFAIVGVTYGLGKYLGVEVEVEVVEAEQKKNNEWQKVGKDGEVEVDEEAGEEDDEEYDDTLLFLPTGLARPKPKTYYRGSDPEWQEFRKIARDRPRIERIRAELVKIVRETMTKVSWCEARIGKVDLGKGKIWVEVTFPDGPPVEFERPGIELTEDLQWRKATRPVEEAHHRRIEKLLYPTVAANALYDDTLRKGAQTWKIFKTYIGWQEQTKAETTEDLARRWAAASPFTKVDLGPSRTPTTTPGSPASANETQRAAASSSQSTSESLLGTFALPDPKKVTLDLAQFRQDLQKNNMKPNLQPPRGTFVMKGLVEVYGDRARITFDVSAAYDPVKGQFVTLDMRIWNFVEHRQAPKGGP